jgi:hypothetical protein
MAYVVQTPEARALRADSLHASATRSDVNEQTGTQYIGVFSFRAGALSEHRVHQKRIVQVGPNHFPPRGSPFTGHIQILPRVLIFTEPKNRSPDSQLDWQTQANSCIIPKRPYNDASRSSLCHSIAQVLH